jgi:hypothetical protein
MIAENKRQRLGAALSVDQQFMAIEQGAERDGRCQHDEDAGEQNEHRGAQPIRSASGIERCNLSGCHCRLSGRTTLQPAPFWREPLVIPALDVAI